MADSKLVADSGAGSPPPNCAICLGTCTNKCFSDSCMHEFCFKCLLEWSKIKPECPLCKQTFKTIIHNIKSNNEYDEHTIENVQVEDNRYLDNASLIYLPPATPPALHQYHFRTTFTVDTHGEHAIQQMLLTHPLLTIGTFTPDRYTHRRRRGDTSTTFRRSVYSQNLWVYAPPDITGRYRDVSPTYYRNNPAARTRLVPWLNRELNALLHENTQQVMRLVDIIMDHLLRHHICSPVFRALLSEYLSNKTDHFIHEFYSFMRSPFDMIGYDRHVIYSERPISPTPYIDVSDYDSDVIFVTPTNNNQQEPQRTEPVIIDLVDTDSDEPIIVSEDRNGENSRCTDEDHNRKPLLPLKLRIKNKHKSKERRVRSKKRRHQVSSSRSSSSSTDSSSDSDSSSSHHKKHHRKKLKERVKKRRIESELLQQPLREVTYTDTEDDIPLSNLANKKKKAKRSDRRHRSHTVTSSSREQKKYSYKNQSDASNHSTRTESSTHDPYENQMNVQSSPSSRQFPPERFRSPGSELSSWRYSDNLNSASDKADSQQGSSPLVTSVVECEKSHINYDSTSADSMYSEYKPHVRSKVNAVKYEDKHKPGPSTSRLKNILRKEESSNLWYSRPCMYDSDSSDS